LARGDRHRRAVADQAQALGIVGIDLEPEQVVGLAGARDLDVALGLEVEVAVEKDAHLVARALAERGQSVGDGGQGAPSALSSGPPAVRPKPGWCMLA